MLTTCFAHDLQAHTLPSIEVSLGGAAEISFEPRRPQSAGGVLPPASRIVAELLDALGCDTLPPPLALAEFLGLAVKPRRGIGGAELVGDVILIDALRAREPQIARGIARHLIRCGIDAHESELTRELTLTAR